MPDGSRGRARQLVLWAPVVGYAAGIFLLSSQSAPDTGWDAPHLDKLGHVLEYAGFGYLAARAFRGHPRPSVAGRFRWLAIALGISYGGLDEWHQALVATRTASVADLWFDALGTILGQWMRK